MHEAREHQARLARGEVEPPMPVDQHALPKTATYSVVIFFAAIALIVLAGFFPSLLHVVENPST